MVKVKLMNRSPITIQPHDSRWYEMPLCEAEIIYGAQQNVQLEFTTSNPK